jgi:hypothetical protein
MRYVVHTPVRRNGCNTFPRRPDPAIVNDKMPAYAVILTHEG